MDLLLWRRTPKRKTASRTPNASSRLAAKNRPAKWPPGSASTRRKTCISSPTPLSAANKPRKLLSALRHRPAPGHRQRCRRSAGRGRLARRRPRPMPRRTHRRPSTDAGGTAALLLSGTEADWTIERGVMVVSNRTRFDGAETVLKYAATEEFLS